MIVEQPRLHRVCGLWNILMNCILVQNITAYLIPNIQFMMHLLTLVRPILAFYSVMGAIIPALLVHTWA